MPSHLFFPLPKNEQVLSLWINLAAAKPLIQSGISYLSMEWLACRMQVELTLGSKRMEVELPLESKGMEVELSLESIELSQESKGMDLD
jgi:hypothetical protein